MRYEGGLVTDFFLVTHAYIQNSKFQNRRIMSLEKKEKRKEERRSRPMRIMATQIYRKHVSETNARANKL